MIKEVKNKKKYLLIFILIAIVSIMLRFIFFDVAHKKDVNIKTVPPQHNKGVVQSEIDSGLIFSQFAKDFNSHQEKNINKYIDGDLGMMMYYYDGPYPIISLKSKIEYEIDWLENDIFENVEFQTPQDYLGDFQFSKTGFFVWRNNGDFSLKDFDNSYTSHPDSFFDDNKKLETLCNFSAKGISKDQNKTFDFYFRLDGKKLTLLALAVATVNDILFADPEASFIPFENKNDIENYLTNHRLFIDEEEKNAYIDFEKKEITYYDFPTDNPFVFEYYEIGKIEENSPKIKSAEIIFYANKIEKDSRFITYFSNKGRFVVYPMGVRPPYVYGFVKK